MAVMLNIPVLIMLFLTFLIFSATLLPLAARNSSDVLPLSPGLHLSISSSFHKNADANGLIEPISTDLMFTVGIPTLDPHVGLFLPILSSPSFNYSTTSNVSSQNLGFSLGFYFSCPVDVNSYCNIYMAVCAGSSGNYTDVSHVYVETSNKSEYFYFNATRDGFVVPVWIVNLHHPIKYPESASLRVHSVDRGSSNNIVELRLMDGDDVVWNVSNITGNTIVMEMQDSGTLVIYDDAIQSSTSKSKPVFLWQSPNRTDMLFEGQKLELGRELTSNDSSYSARMEKGALVLYINTLQFYGLQRPPAPYWIYPLPRSPNEIKKLMTASDSINRLINSAPCSPSSAYADINHTVYIESDNSSYSVTFLSLQPGKLCTNDEYYAEFYQGSTRWINVSWTFLRLENDGRLYMYAVSNPVGDQASFTRISLATSLAFYPSQDFHNDQWAPWGECDVPMACGRAGLCTPGAETPCTCDYADTAFEPSNGTAIRSYGCKRRTHLPPCSISGNGHINSTDFVQINQTASIFLVNGWTLNSTRYASHHVDDCKNSCSANCSCTGFFYQVDTSVCFFITEEFSLLNIEVDRNFSWYGVFEKEILAKNYVTYLKVATAAVELAENKASAPIALTVILPSVFAACFVFGSGAYLLIRAWKRKLIRMRMHKREENELRDILPLLPSRFSYKDLHEATKGFSNLLGEGGCGCVYAGILGDGRKVAVKVLQIVIQGASQSKQFLAEVATVGRTGHHNIVRLLGFCWEASNRLLVYEYVERGSLDRWLFVGDSALVLDWETRYKVALGIARGLHYLHEECEQAILHFDIKPQNILLDDQFVAKLADFGMSRLMQRDISAVMTGVRGTPGYIAPEWFRHGTGSKKSDVYSTGMVMLEIVGGRKILEYSLLSNSLDKEEQEAWHFPSWAASKCEQGLLMEVVDKRLLLQGCGFDREQARRLIHIAFWCIHDDPAIRPNAPTLVHWLESTSPIEEPAFSAPIDNAVWQARKHYSESVL